MAQGWYALAKFVYQPCGGVSDCLSVLSSVFHTNAIQFEVTSDSAAQPGVTRFWKSECLCNEFFSTKLVSGFSVLLGVEVVLFSFCFFCLVVHFPWPYNWACGKDRRVRQESNRYKALCFASSYFDSFSYFVKQHHGSYWKYIGSRPPTRVFRFEGPKTSFENWTVIRRVCIFCNLWTCYDKTATELKRENCAQIIGVGNSDC